MRAEKRRRDRAGQEGREGRRKGGGEGSRDK